MPQNIYDNPHFFERYRALRDKRAGLNESLEQPAFRSLLPDPAGSDVLDLGCGAGEMCRYLSERGAESVVGVDISERMLGLAREAGGSRISYRLDSAESSDFREGEFDLVVSSLMFHYVEDLRDLVARIRRWLRPRGSLVFSMEHPFATAAQGKFENGWLDDDRGNRVAWKVAAYSSEGRRVARWWVDGVVKYHRTTATVINTLVDSGFCISKVLEPHAPEEEERMRPDLLAERMRPPFLFVAAGAAG